MTAYQLCALELPWPTQDVTGKAAMLHDTQQPVDILEACPKLDPKLGSLIMKCLQVQPSSRPQSIDEIKRTLKAIPGS